MQNGNPVKNSLLILLKAIVVFICFQVVVSISFLIGHLIERTPANGQALEIFNFSNHKILAWTGLFLLLVGLPISDLFARFIIRRRSYGLYFMELSWLKFALGYLTGMMLSALIFYVLLMTGFAKIVAFPIRLKSQELVASILSYTLIMVLIGFYEELIFRGIFTCELSRRWNNWILGSTAGGLIFSVIHLNNVQTSSVSKIKIVVSGLIFSWFLSALMLHYKSLKVAMGFHAGWNYFLGGFMGCTLSGKQFGLTPFQTVFNGSSLISGGDFGLETSLLVNCVFIALIIIFWKKSQFQKHKMAK